MTSTAAAATAAYQIDGSDLDGETDFQWDEEQPEKRTYQGPQDMKLVPAELRTLSGAYALGDRLQLRWAKLQPSSQPLADLTNDARTVCCRHFFSPGQSHGIVLADAVFDYRTLPVATWGLRLSHSDGAHPFEFALLRSPTRPRRGADLKSADGMWGLTNYSMVDDGRVRGGEKNFKLLFRSGQMLHFCLDLRPPLGDSAAPAGSARAALAAAAAAKLPPSLPNFHLFIDGEYAQNWRVPFTGNYQFCQNLWNTEQTVTLLESPRVKAAVLVVDLQAVRLPLPDGVLRLVAEYVVSLDDK